MCADCHALDYIVILHELSALVLVVVLDGSHRFADIACITPVRAISEFTAAKLAGIIVVEHLLDNNLEVLLRDLVLGSLLAVTTSGTAILHVHNGVTFRLHLVPVP